MHPAATIQLSPRPRIAGQHSRASTTPADAVDGAPRRPTGSADAGPGSPWANAPPSGLLGLALLAEVGLEDARLHDDLADLQVGAALVEHELDLALGLGLAGREALADAADL